MPRSRRKKHQPINQSSILQWFHHTEKVQKLKDKIEEQHAKAPRAKVYVNYRNDGKVRGTGAAFDHMALQQITETPSVVINLNPEEQKVYISEYLRENPDYNLPYGEEEQGKNTHLKEINSPDQISGLVYIPGIPRDKKNNRDYLNTPRHTNTQDLLQAAINRGMPVLAICGGAWEVLDKFNGKITDVKDHSCSTGMPRLNSAGKVGFNIQVHRIQLPDGPSILRGAMQYDKHAKVNKFPTVNSVHWCAPCEKTFPYEYFDISARSIHDPELAPKNRRGRQMEPENNVIEAFESRFGAPILCVQWHPEAYTANTPQKYFPRQQQALIRYMVEAGKTYELKQQLNKELLLFDDITLKTPSSKSQLFIPPSRQCGNRLRFWKKAYCEEKKLAASYPKKMPARGAVKSSLAKRLKPEQNQRRLDAYFSING